MVITITGKIVEYLPKREGVSKAGTAWASQDFVIEEENGDINVFNVFGQDKLDQYGLKRGMTVSAKCVLKAQEWQGKYFTKLSCMQCFISQDNSQSVQQERQQQAQQQMQQTKQVQQEPVKKVDADELPF